MAFGGENEESVVTVDPLAPPSNGLTPSLPLDCSNKTDDDDCDDVLCSNHEKDHCIDS